MGAKREMAFREEQAGRKGIAGLRIRWQAVSGLLMVLP
jgi:hypothetical protein